MRAPTTPAKTDPVWIPILICTKEKTKRKYFFIQGNIASKLKFFYGAKNTSFKNCAVQKKKYFFPLILCL